MKDTTNIQGNPASTGGNGKIAMQVKNVDDLNVVPNIDMETRIKNHKDYLLLSDESKLMWKQMLEPDGNV